MGSLGKYPASNRDISSLLFYHQPKPQANVNGKRPVHKYEAKAPRLRLDLHGNGDIACGVEWRDMALVQLVWDYLV
jgi:hypothetical protein